jgi:hypothetical protein
MTQNSITLLGGPFDGREVVVDKKDNFVTMPIQEDCGLMFCTYKRSNSHYFEFVKEYFAPSYGARRLPD